MQNTFAASATVRACIAKALGGQASAEFARRRWGAASTAAALVMRAGVTGLEASEFGARTGDDEFFSSVFDALPFAKGNFRRVGFHKRLLAITEKLSGHWVAQSKGIPVSRPTLVPSTLMPKKVAALAIQTQEAFEDPLSEPLVEAELRAAAVGAIVQALLDPANGGDDTTPASLTHSGVAMQIPATAEPGDDIAAALAAFGGDLSQAVFMLDPVSAVQLALARDANGKFAFPAIGARGGAIVGIPAFVFSDAPRDTSGGVIALVDPTGTAYALDNIEIERSRQATIECDSAPQGATDTPVASSATLVSLFQNDLLAHKIVVRANWEVQRPDGAVAITGVDYLTAAP